MFFVLIVILSEAKNLYFNDEDSSVARSAPSE